MLNDAILNVGANAMRLELLYLSLHSATPSAAGSNPTTAGRQPTSWAVPVNGDLVSPNVINFSGGEPNGPVKAVGFWTALVGGTYWGYYPLDGSKTFNISGQYALDPFTLVGSSY